MARSSLLLVVTMVVPFLAKGAPSWAKTYRYQAALFCEFGNNFIETRNEPIYPCYRPGRGCAATLANKDWSFPGGDWMGYEYQETYHLKCNQLGGNVGMCFINPSGGYTYTDWCTSHNADANLVIIKTRTSRRQLRGRDALVDDESSVSNFDGPTKVVEIDGESIVLVNPDYYEEEEDDDDDGDGED